MLKYLGSLLCLVPALLLAQTNVAGEYLVTEQYDGGHYYHNLVLTVEKGKLGGDYNGATIVGTVSGTNLRFVATPQKGNPTEYVGTVTGENTLAFERVIPGTDVKYAARRILKRPEGPPRRHEFVPTSYYREFSDHIKPVLTVWPGDTIHTTTVDSGGTDGNGVSHGLAGNPQTGPFYIEGAMPGDTLAVHFNRVRLNRDYAMTGSKLVPRVMSPNLAAKMETFKVGGSRWRLDRERGVATLANPTEAMKNFSIPVRPMVGCVAVAPRGTPLSAADSGITGGNMDLNEIVEGTTVYLPVIEPGALLYVGDGHAVQGDGEITGSGLETSLELEFTVDIVHPLIMTPRVDTPTHLIAVGLAGSLDEAIRTATGGLMQWLEQSYKLTPLEIVQVLGPGIEYSVSEVADRNAGVVAKINKKYLASLTVSKP